MEPVGCVFYDYEPPSRDFPGAEGCFKGHCTRDLGVFDPEIPCPGCGEDHGCGPDCPGYEEAA